jgi:hypothetical protein
MSRSTRRGFTTATATALTAVGLVLATPSTLEGGVPSGECIGYDRTQERYDSDDGPDNRALDMLAGTIVGFAAEVCGNEEPGERVVMQRLGYGTIKLTYTRVVPGASKSEHAGAYTLSATTVLTPDGLLSPVAATEMSAKATVYTPTQADPASAKDIYTMQGTYDLGKWEVTTDSSSEYGSFVELGVEDPHISNACGATHAIMADAEQGNPLAWQAR